MDGDGTMTDRLIGRTALVTGAASGIGAAIARRFVEEGANVVLADLQGDRCAAVAADLGNAARAITVDVTNEDQVAGAVDFAVSEFGRLDCMVNNAGIVGAVGPIADTSGAAWRATMAILVDGTFFGMKHAARVMIPQGSGSIISLASTAAVLGGLGPHCYTTAKHAVVGLTKSAASELGAHGIRVNCLAPGSTVTPMTADVITDDPTDLEGAEASIAQRSPMGRAAQARDMANVALFLASDEAAFVSGICLVADSGQTAAPSPYPYARDPGGILREAGRRTL